MNPLHLSPEFPIYVAGIDIGSRSVEFVVMNADTFEVTERFRGATSIDLASQLAEIRANYQWDAIASTGYGRFLSQKVLGGEAATEIKAYATAAHHFHREIGTVIDLGGQDTKVLSIDRNNGQLLKFEMNDKCSAGTGKFFEMMAATLGLTLDELVAAALRGERSFEINSTCTVFAESEVISLLTSGKSVEDIARAVHESLLVKLVSLLSRILTADSTSVLFVGGGARNNTLVKFLADALAKEVIVPEYPDFFGAYGAAMVAKNSLMRLR
ncbi:3-hydroxyacyl-ACP dehydratase [Geomonas sp. Red276]